MVVYRQEIWQGKTRDDLEGMLVRQITFSQTLSGFG